MGWSRHAGISLLHRSIRHSFLRYPPDLKCLSKRWPTLSVLKADSAPRGKHAHSWFVVVRCVTSRQTSWSLFWPRVLHFRHGLRPNLGFSICLLVVVSSLSVSTFDNVFCTCCLLLRNSHHYFWKIQLEKLSLLGCLNWT